MLKLDHIAAYIQARLTRNDEGATAVEYGLLVSLIAIAIIVAVTAFGKHISDIFTGMTAKF
jgi:pilus assembly protein Flp/PilA